MIKRNELQKAIKDTIINIDEINGLINSADDISEKERLLHEIKRLEYQMLQYKDQLKRLDMN